MKYGVFAGLLAGIVVATLLMQIYPMVGINSHNEHPQLVLREYRETLKIEGNDNFTAENGVRSGNGTQENPYVISNWVIDAHGNSTGIYVGNTTAYFIIENCTVRNASYYYSNPMSGAAILLYNVYNASIRNVSAYDSDDGIAIYNGGDNLISEVNVTNDTSGVFIKNSNHNRLEGVHGFINLYGLKLEGWSSSDYGAYNVIVNSTFKRGSIYVDSCIHTLFDNVSVYNSSDNGIDIESGRYIEIRNSTISYTGGSGIYMYNSYYNNITNVVASHNGQGGVYPYVAGIELESSNRNKIVDLRSDNNVYGVSINHGEYNVFDGANLSSDKYGFDVSTTNHNLILNSTVWNALDTAISITSYSGGYGVYNELKNVSVINTSGEGVYTDHADGTNITSSKIEGKMYMELGDNNTVRDSDVYGDIHLQYQTYGIIENTSLHGGSILIDGSMEEYSTQTIKNTTVNGQPVYYFKNRDLRGHNIPDSLGELIAVNVTNLSMSRMSISNATVSVVLGYSSHVELENMNIGNMTKYGIYAVHTDNITISNSTFATGDATGIDLEHCENISIKSSILNKNDEGMYISYGKYAIFDNITVQNNSWRGIYLYKSSHMYLDTITISGNENGIAADGGESIDLDNISATNNENPISIDGGRNNIVENSHIWNNSYGIRDEYTNGDKIINSTIENNSGNGIYVDDGNYFHALNIKAMYNDGYGILIKGAHNFVERSEFMKNKKVDIEIEGDNTSVFNTKLADTGVGINIKSERNTIYGNEMHNEGIVIYGARSVFKSQQIGINNTVNGKKSILLQ